MTIAEKMAEDIVEYFEELHVTIFDEDMAELRGELGILIKKVAERGAHKAKSAIVCDTPIVVIEGVGYVELSRAQDAIGLDRWWEEKI